MLKASGPTGSNQRAASSSAFPLLASPGLAGWRAGPAGPCPGGPRRTLLVQGCGWAGVVGWDHPWRVGRVGGGVGGLGGVTGGRGKERVLWLT